MAARNRALSRGQLLLKKGHSRWSMVKVMCCQSQSGRICCCSVIHCSVALCPQALQAFDLQLWQKKRECVQSGEAQQYRFTPMAAVPQVSIRSTQNMVQGLRVSPYLSIYWFQASSMVNSSFAGRGIYMRRIIALQWHRHYSASRHSHRPSCRCAYPRGRRSPAACRIPWR